MRVLAAVVVSTLVLAVAADLWLTQRIEHRVEEGLACRSGIDAQVDIAWWRGLPALVTRSVGTVRLDLPLDQLATDRPITLSGDDGMLVAQAERADASIVLRPSVSDGRMSVEVVGVRIGGREVGGLLADAISSRVGGGGLGDGLGLERMPDAVHLTDVDVTDDDLVVEAQVDPDGLRDQDLTACS